MGITCKQAVDYISKKEEKKLSVNQRLQLWKHLSICSLCKLFSKQNELISSLLSKRSEEIQHNIKPVDKEAIIKALKEAEES